MINKASFKKNSILSQQIGINFNWDSLILICFLVCYGMFGVHTSSAPSIKSGILLNAPLNSFIAISLFVFGYFSLKNPKQSKDCFSVTIKDLIIFFPLAILIFLISYENLSFSLFADEISYSSSAFKHSQLILFSIASKSSFLEDFSASSLLRVISLILLISTGIFLSLLFRLTFFFQLLITFFVIILLRTLVSIMGGSEAPHPPLNLIPIFLSGSVFGISSFSLKLSSLISLLFFLFAIYQLIKKLIPTHNALIVTAVIGTTPLLLMLGSAVEQSLWSTLCFTYVILYLLIESEPNFNRLIYIASIMTLFRQPSFLALVPIGIILIASWKKESNILKSFGNFYPAFLFIPFLYVSITNGTPSTNAINNLPLLQTLTILESASIGLLNHLPVWLLVFIPLAFIPYSKHSIKKSFAFFIFLISLIIVYYSINQGLWGEAKYQAEIGIPLISLGILNTSIFFTRVIKIKDYFVSLALVFLVMLNLWSFVSLHTKNRTIDDLANNGKNNLLLNSGYHSLVTYPYNMEAAFQRVTELEQTTSTLSLGNTYGIFTELLNNYSLNDLMRARDIYKDHSSYISTDSKEKFLKINQDNRINLVLFSSGGNKELMSIFLQNKWNLLDTFRNDKYGSSVYLVKREDTF